MHAATSRSFARSNCSSVGCHAVARAHDLDLAASVHVGDGAADRGFAARLGLRFVETAAFVAGHWGAPP